MGPLFAMRRVAAGNVFRSCILGILLVKGANRKRLRFRRLLAAETLEGRRLLSAAPFGALPQDTAEFMLGRVVVTPVFLESDGSLDSSSEDWTPAQIDQTLQKVDEAMQWWVDTLDTLSTIHSLEFIVDETFARNPFETPYEAISRDSDDYLLYTSEFFAAQGFTSGGLNTQARAFNHAQRLSHEADWAFSIFVADSENDADGAFAAGGSFSRAFAFAGGLFFVAPSTRPASTFAHETGHIFYARDEYTGGGSWSQHRGYYNTQNLNAADNPTPGFVQQPSIMSSGTVLSEAYANHVSPPSTLAMVGWQDSDGDGIFDVLDNSIDLQGVGRYAADSGRFLFTGSASITTLLNRNSEGLQSDITLSTVSRIQYRIDGGQWTDLLLPGVPQVELDISLPIPAGFSTLGLRAVDSLTGNTSRELTFSGLAPHSATDRGLSGSIRWERDGNSAWDAADNPLDAFEVRIAAGDGTPLSFHSRLEPDELPGGDLKGEPIRGAILEAIGDLTAGGVAALTSEGAVSTGTKSFWGHDAFRSTWTETWGDRDTLQLKAAFDAPTTVVSIDVIGSGTESYGRLTAYREDGSIVDRTTSGPLADGAIATLRVHSDRDDIAYVVAGGHGNTKVKLDNLTYGSPLVVKTDSYGSFQLPHLPAGSYRAEAVPWSDAFVSNAASQTFDIAGQSLATLDFAFDASRNPWRNPDNPRDVDADGEIFPVDALRVINELNRGGPKPLSGADAPGPFLDVDGDGRLGPLDALQIINALNAGIAGAAEPPGTPLPAPSPPGSFAVQHDSAEDLSGDPQVFSEFVGPAAYGAATLIPFNDVQVASAGADLAVPGHPPAGEREEQPLPAALIDQFFSEPFEV